MRRFRRTRHADCNLSEEIAINIGGVKHILYRDELNRYPKSRVAELLNRATDSTHEVLYTLCDDYDHIKREFFFDRDPEAFKCILELYYSGEIHIKRGICPMRFMKEMEYWGIDEEYLDECCSSRLNEMKTEQAEIAEKVKSILSDLEEDGAVSRAQRWRIFLEKLMEKPESSLAARMIAVISILFVLISSVVMCLGTIPELQVRDDMGKLEEHPTFMHIETACIIWFTLEYILQFMSSSNKCRFIFSLENIIDFLVIMPFYLVMILKLLGTSMVELSHMHQAMQTFHILRVARIFKLARHSSGLQTLALSLKSSVSELGLLLMYMSVGTFLFSALGYTLEQTHSETLFTSIPQSFWWAIITMTTVGYGDVYPKTSLGKCTAAVSSLCGILFISLPVRLIMNNFLVFYNKHCDLEISARHEIELMALHEKEEVQEHPGDEEVPSTGNNPV